jgi:subtilase family serine protease
MVRRLGMTLLLIGSLVTVASTVCDGQSLPPLTRHVHEATLRAQAGPTARLAPTQNMRIVLVLPIRDQADLDSFLQDVYSPSSPNYRHFLTVDEFTARFGPTQADYDSVIQFAETNGLTVVGTSRNRMNVDVAGSVANIEEAFHLKMGVYQHPSENRTYFGPDREPTPDLMVRLWRVAGLDNYSAPHANIVRRNANVNMNPNATTGSGPSSSFLGSDMRAAYYGGTALTGAGQSLGLLEYYGTDLADLNKYFANVGQTNHVPVTLLSTDGTSTSCVSPACDDTEQTLDMTQALGMAPGLSNLVVYVGSSDAAIFNAMATASLLNAQLSSSWTWTPADPSVDNPYFQEFAAQGQNLFQASGDSGAWKSSSAIYPADDAFLTTVGGTDLNTTGAGGSWSSESAWVDGGGGISPDRYAIPSWQTSAASTCGDCSTLYRNGPDVSANANFTFYVCADQTSCTANLYGGTSFAAPMWAGYLALVNQQAVANGNHTVGFINPGLYSIGLGSNYNTDFHDINSGSNGLPATIGYDLATGWGSPNGSGLITALAGSSSAPGFSLSASPGSVSVVQGSSGNSTITSTVTGGFNSAISLTASGQPAGVTVSFNPTSISGAGNSTVTMNVASSTVTGTYVITVKGTSGSVTATTTVSLKVTGTNPNFAITAAPASITISRSGSGTGTSTITTTISGGFNSSISLSASGAGNNNTVTFSPSSIAARGAGTSTMTIRVGRRSSTGSRTVMIKGTAGSLTQTTTLTLTITK